MLNLISLFEGTFERDMSVGLFHSIYSEISKPCELVFNRLKGFETGIVELLRSWIEIAPVVMLMEGAGGDDRLMSVISGLACVISAGIKEIPRSAVHYNSEHVTGVDARSPWALSARCSTARRVNRQL